MTYGFVLVLGAILTVVVVGLVVWAIVDQNNFTEACEAVGGVAVIDWQGWNQCVQVVNK